MAFDDVCVRFDNVRCGFPKADFSLLIDQQARGGEVIACIGINGSGKSTCLQSLSLTLPIGAGQLCLRVCKEGVLYEQVVGARTKLDDLAIRYIRNQLIGCVPQEHGLLPSLTVAENVKLSSDIAGLPVEPRAILESLARFGVEAYAKRRASTLSVGQQQRVAIASGLFHKPAIVLLDEPTAAVQANKALEFMSLVRDYARNENALIIMACHDLSLAADFADRFWLFAHGQVQDVPVNGGHSEWRTQEEVRRLSQRLGVAMSYRIEETDLNSFSLVSHYGA